MRHPVCACRWHHADHHGNGSFSFLLKAQRILYVASDSRHAAFGVLPDDSVQGGGGLCNCASGISDRGTLGGGDCIWRCTGDPTVSWRREVRAQFYLALVPDDSCYIRCIQSDDEKVSPEK